MRVVIHGGMHKTGTKSLQWLLHQQTDLLWEYRIAYPNDGQVHHSSLVNLRHPKWDSNSLGILVEGARSSGAEVLLLSSEVMSNLSSDQFLQIGRCFPDCEVTYVFCFRHWNAFLPSRWAQNCKRRDSQPFDQYVRMVAPRGSGHCDVWFDQVLDRAVGSGARVVGVSYQNAITTGEGVIPAVLKALGFPVPLIALLLPHGQVRNQRIDWMITELARMLNGAAAERLNLPQDDLCGSLGRFRECPVFFDFTSRLALLDKTLLDNLCAALRRYSAEYIFSGLPAIDEAYDRLQNSHAHRYSNLGPVVNSP